MLIKYGTRFTTKNKEIIFFYDIVPCNFSSRTNGTRKSDGNIRNLPHYI